MKKKVGDAFNDVMEHARSSGFGDIDPRKIQELEGRFGTNGGKGCDVAQGPCSCGAWH